MEAGLVGCFIRPGTTSAQLLLHFDPLWSPQGQRGEGKAWWRKSGEACAETRPWLHTVYLGGDPRNDGRGWKSDAEKRNPTEGVC